MVTFPPTNRALVAYLKSHQTCVHVCRLSCVFIWFSTVLKNPEKDSAHAARQAVGFVWCTHKPELLIAANYQAGAHASHLRDQVLSSLTWTAHRVKAFACVFWGASLGRLCKCGHNPLFRVSMEMPELQSLAPNFGSGGRLLILSPPCGCQLHSCSRSSFCSEY